MCFWTDRIQFRVEIPGDTAHVLSSFTVSRLEAVGEPIEGLFKTAMIERWGGRAFVHGYLVFPRGTETFFQERDIVATFRFGKKR